MRNKEEILSDCRRDVIDKDFKDSAANWLAVRQVEVLIDIRDILEKRLESLYYRFEAIHETLQ